MGFGLADAGVERTAHRPAAGARNNAIRAAEIAAVLNLEKGAPVTRRGWRGGGEDIGRSAFGEYRVRHARDQFIPRLPRNDQRNAGGCERRAGGRFRDAAGKNHERPLRAACEPAAEAEALLFGGAGDGAGVDHHDIRVPILLNHRPPLRNEFRRKCIGLRLIEAAAKGLNGDAHQFNDAPEEALPTIRA